MSVSARPALALGAALSALALLAAPAVAQKYYDDEIVVTPPVYSDGTSSRGGGPNERITAYVIVSTRDLDLRSSADVDILRQRIRDGARIACDQAETQLRTTGGNPAPDQASECYRGARSHAMREARLMVDYARG